MTIGKQVGLLSGGLLALCAVLGAVALVSLSRIDSRVNALTTDAMPGLEYIGKISASVHHFRGNTWKHVSAIDPQAMAQVEQELDALKQETAQNMDAYERAIAQPEDRVNFDRFAHSWRNSTSAGKTKSVPSAAWVRKT
jgi:hypothetical protein